MYFKSKTVGNTVLFGGTTAKYVPIDLMKKNREVIVLHRDMDVPKLIDDLSQDEKTIFVCGGYSIYKYFLDNFIFDEIFFSKIKDTVKVENAKEPLYLPKIEDYGYKKISGTNYDEFIAYIYKR